jgi:NitT/TauT family transport system ATP-binding protein
MTFLRIRDLTKEFMVTGGRRLMVLDRISLDVRKREFFTILGPNGCGKTTLLKILAGFEDATEGEVLIRNSPPADAKSYLVLQSPDCSLFNWMRMRENIELATNSESVYDRKTLDNLLGRIEVGGKTLQEFSSHYPYQLSGGLKQLAVIARAIVFRPDLLLLDEPFSSLDFRTSAQMEDSLLRICGDENQTVVFVSHNIEEAVYMSDRIALLSNQPTKVSEIIEVGLPRPRRQSVKFSRAFRKTEKKIHEFFTVMPDDR